MSRRLTTRLVANAVLVAALCMPQLVMADFSDGVRQFVGRPDAVPPPSIVQVLAPEPGALSRGSGTLIHVDGQFGYVITNWHVVRDAPGDVVIVFPDGHQSLARVLKTDESWDLALLLIWRGNAAPMPLSAVAPQPGQPLTIAGYGGEGKFRAARGVFTTYAAPEPDMPYEMFEVSVAARQGDSGGPIVNQRGELVGVLFGAGDGRTTGTQVHRVRDFVNTALAELRDQAEAVAAAPPQPPVASPVDAIQSESFAQNRSTAENHRGFASVDVPPQYMPPTYHEGPAAGASAQSTWESSPRASTNWREDETDDGVSPARSPEPPQLAAQGFPERTTRPEIDFERDGLPPPLASIAGERNEAARTHQAAGMPGSSLSRTGFPLQSPPQIPAGGITWDQLRSFFAAVGVFAMLNTVTRTLLVRKG